MNSAQQFIVLDAVDAVEETYVVSAAVFGDGTIGVACVWGLEGENLLVGKEKGKILIGVMAEGVGLGTREVVDAGG